MSFDPEFIPGSVRAELEEIDRAIAAAESNILDGRCKDWPEYRHQIGVRHGLQMAKAMKLKRLSEEQQRRLG